MHRFHSGLTIAAPVKKGKLAELNNTLKQLQHQKCCFNFDDAETLLFVSGVILPAQDYHGEMLPETFVLSTSYAGSLREHLNDLLRTGKKGICSIFRHCKGFPEGDLVSDRDLIFYLKSYACRSTFGSRYQCMTRLDVQREKDLRKLLQTYIDKAQGLNAFQGLQALQIRTLIQRHVKNQGPEYKWAHQPDKKTLQEAYLLHESQIWLLITALLIATLLLIKENRTFLHTHVGAVLFIVIPMLLVLFSITPWIARTKTFTAPRSTDDHYRRLMASQLHPVMNEMTAAAPLKKGKVRRHFYRAVLRIITLFGPGFLKVPTVSTIRWLVIDNRKRLVFLSNFTNTSDAYVRDFLNGKKVPWGVNFMFSNGMGFPDANLFFFKGVFANPEGYMNAVHQGQHVAGLQYAHDPMLSIDIIRKNRRIRNGLFKRMTEAEAQEWLQLL